MVKIWMLTAVLLCPSFLFSQSTAKTARHCGGVLSHADVAGIKQVIETYRTSWLKNDAEPGVESTLLEESVLLPAHGATPVVGMKEIQKFWWPPNAPPTKILQLDISVEEVGGNACLAFARGHDTVAWSVEQDGKTTRTRHGGTYLNVMKKSPDGKWHILQHMWDDQPDEHF
jgi:ketosteroid isomerase-like protein